MAINTSTSRPSWSPDLIATLDADDIVPEALIIQTGTYAGSVEGDSPSVRVPYVPDDGDAAIVAEGGTITPDEPTPAEITFSTYKVSKLIKTSREQIGQPGAAERLAKSMSRAVIATADDVYLNNPATPAGLLLTGSLATAGDLGGATAPDVFAAYDAVGAIENDGGQATHVLFNPLDWAELCKLPDESGSVRSLLADVHDASRRSLAGVPVLVSNRVTAGAALMLDKSEVITAYGDVQLARSDDFYFDSDSVAIRLTWRIGFKVARPARLQKLTVGAA